MSAWKRWNLQVWNERLLAHFFRSDEEHNEPVVVLLVTGEELARATGDTEANPEDVRDAFLEAAHVGIRHSKSLIEDATDYEGWPNPPHRALSPRFVAHLLFTCIAASESSDELADEGSFVSRLRTLTRDQLPDNSLHWLPRLWEYLRDWLVANSDRYRPLILPDPGGFTRIGYTIKLAFPDRRDQRQLSELLDRAGLSGCEPPVGRVLSLVASERDRFRRSFVDAYSEFRNLFETSTSDTQFRVRNHRFWAAIRDAALRGRGYVAATDVSARLSLLCAEEEDRLALFAVADQTSEDIGLGFAELPVPYGPWRFALMPRGSSALDAHQLEQITRAILNGSLRLPGLSNQVDQGLLPLMVGAHGLLELAGREQLDEVSVALVRKEMVADLVRVMGRSSVVTHNSSYDGWIEVHGLGLHTMPFQELEGTTLSRTWILHQSLSPTSIRLRGGVRADDGWLGVREVLPRVVATGASAVVLERDSVRVALTRLEDGTWSFPPHDLTGSFTLIASLDGREDRRKVVFHVTPSNAVFKAPKEPDAWILEEIGGTGTLSRSLPFTVDRAKSRCSQVCERTAYLGTNVGDFVRSPDTAAWRITSFGGKFIGARARMRGDDAIPSAWASSANARRRWRKLLFESVASWSDPGFEQARNRVKPYAVGHSGLSRLETQQCIPDLSPMRVPPTSERVDRLIRVIAGRSAMRSGIDYREWSELARCVLDIDSALLGHVTRAWMEAGLIDVVSYARWRHRTVFARPPRIVAFEIDDYFGASISGLAPAIAAEEVRRAAVRIGMLVEDRFSVSSLVPGTIAVRAPDTQSLDELARTCQLNLHWLDLNCLLGGMSSRHEGASVPPQHYEHKSCWSHWSLKGGEYAGVLFEHRVRPDRPDYWLVSSNGSRVWSYDLNIARAWAASFLGDPIVISTDRISLEANHAYVPLPIARVTSILGAALPGPTDGGKYSYPLGVPALRELVLGSIVRTYDLVSQPASILQLESG